MAPWYVTGMTDAEGCFACSIRKRPKSVPGFQAELIYDIGAKNTPANRKMLEGIQSFFEGRGRIRQIKPINFQSYQVTRQEDIKVIRDHFENYPLQSTKALNFSTWCQINDVLEKGGNYFSREDFNHIIGLKAQFKMGLNATLLEAFPNYPKLPRPTFVAPEGELDPNWIAGFTNGDGHFAPGVVYNKKMKYNQQLTPRFDITQHERDRVQLNRILATMGCGQIKEASSGRDRISYEVTGRDNQLTYIIPFFEKNPLYGAKAQDFVDWTEIVKQAEDGAHLHPDGLGIVKILAIKERMNSNRKEKP